MDYRALAELILMGAIGISIVAVAIGFSVRVFLAPVVREALERLGSRSQTDQLLLAGRLEAVEDRLAELEGGLDRLAEGADFDRRLEGPRASGSGGT